MKVLDEISIMYTSSLGTVLLINSHSHLLSVTLARSTRRIPAAPPLPGVTETFERFNHGCINRPSAIHLTASPLRIYSKRAPSDCSVIRVGL